eukprot:scaffold447986_cov34-Prasinocladus_malaysianus.AAC.1
MMKIGPGAGVLFQSSCYVCKIRGGGWLEALYSTGVENQRSAPFANDLNLSTASNVCCHELNLGLLMASSKYRSNA